MVEPLGKLGELEPEDLAIQPERKKELAIQPERKKECVMSARLRLSNLSWILQAQAARPHAQSS